MKDRDMTMEEYVQYENEKDLKNCKIYNWETAMYGKIRGRLLALLFSEVGVLHVNWTSYRPISQCMEYYCKRDGSAEVHHYDNCDNNDIFNMFTQEEQYTELLEPIFEPHQIQQNDSNVIPKVSSVEQSGGTVDQHPETVEKTRAYFESLYYNLAIEVEKVNSVNRKMKEINVDLTTELARYKNQEKCFEISQEKYDKLERCYQKSVYQEKSLTKKINALHLSFAKTITTLNEEIANLNNMLSKEKSSVSSLLEEKKS
nr:hypothetical protein [Tanacetum cinerariifolium]